MKTPLTSMLLFAVVLSACTAQVQHGLEERDANEIVSVLTGRGIKAQKVPEKGKKPTYAIEVDDDDLTEAMRVLTELKLPKTSRPTTRSIMQNTSLIETPTAERLRQLEAQEGDLEETLETIDGVTSASIELVVPTPARPGLPPVASKASVLLRVRPEAVEHLQTQRAELRALVAGSVEGLKVDDVVLVVDEVALLPTAPAGSGAAEEAPTQQQHLRALVIALGLSLVVLAIVLIMLTLRLRAAKRAPAKEVVAERPIPAAAPKPTVNAAVQRKVA